jgi:hypothetical protein
MPNSAKKVSLLIVLLFQLSGIIYAQQISGNVFIDRDGLTNNNINTSFGVNNPTTNIGGVLLQIC